MIPKPLATAIVCLITLVWLGNFAAQFFIADYQVDGWIHSIFLTVVGGALAFSRKGNGESTDPPPAPPVETVALPAPEPPPEPRRPGGAHRALLALLPRRALA